MKFEVNALRTIRVLRRDAFKHTTTASPESVVTALKKEVDQIFNNSQVRHPCKYDVENLVLQLIAAGILNFEVKGRDRTNKKGDKEKVLSIHLFLAVQGEEEAREDGDSEDRWFFHPFFHPSSSSPVTVTDTLSPRAVDVMPLQTF